MTSFGCGLHIDVSGDVESVIRGGMNGDERAVSENFQIGPGQMYKARAWYIWPGSCTSGPGLVHLARALYIWPGPGTSCPGLVHLARAWYIWPGPSTSGPGLVHYDPDRSRARFSSGLSRAALSTSAIWTRLESED